MGLDHCEASACHLRVLENLNFQSVEFLPRWAGQNLFGMIKNLTVVTASILNIQLQFPIRKPQVY